MNKTGRKGTSQKEKSITWKMFTAFGTQGSQVRILPLRPIIPANYFLPIILAIHFSGLFLIAGGSRVNRRFPSKVEHRPAFPRRMARPGLASLALEMEVQGMPGAG
ncbi:hypothetical protein [Bradyrhizobium sp. sBnM-33]|uniref:hypothetical protein n=1 Tax=Bradyrhizobium sp. sBnM-33 TaxID=2831780 RepID=UPI001BCF2C79|nr:hypothetical protein [Bradyrhizobium sp. sBnM-33]WOH53412.1 hypothetical protein RX328_15795 [Bradyrhizobium sp. sBnM-33]